MSETSEVRIYPVVSPEHWGCPECGFQRIQARGSITEYRAFLCPTIVYPDGKITGNTAAGEVEDLYDSDIQNDFALECYNCGNMIDSAMAPGKGSVADLIARSHLGVTGVAISLGSTVKESLFMTCDSDGTLRAWKWESPVCRNYKGRAVWEMKPPTGSGHAVGIINPQISAAIPTHMLHMVGWIFSWRIQDETIGAVGNVLRGVLPLLPSGDWWKVRQVEHKLLY